MDWIMVGITLALLFGSALLISFCEYLENIK
jgi:hypothetical protein